MEFVAIWLFCGIIAAVIATSRGRSGCGWLLLGVLFGPFSFAVALLPKVEPEPEGTVKCPYCAELVKPEAVKCKHCGSDIARQPHTGKGSRCSTCDYVFIGDYGKEGWFCPNCRKVNH